MAQPSGFKIRHWTEIEIEALKRLRSLKKSWRDIGTEIGRSPKAAKQKWLQDFAV